MRPSGQQHESVELSHLLLLRLCRSLDLWRGHEVEEVLKDLLSNPEAVRPLPPPVFVAVIDALRKYQVPKELTLRLVSSFLDRVESGQAVVQPDQWANLACSVRAVDDATSWERVTPRLIQKIVPHLAELPAELLVAVMRALASKPLPPREQQAVGSSRSSNVAHASSNPLDMAPGVAAEAVQKAVQGSKLDIAHVVDLLGSLGKLGWYSDGAISAALTRCSQTPLLEAHAPLILPLARACADLRVHHAPLLHKLVLWYGWCYTYLRPKPLAQDQLDELIDIAHQFLELSFQSVELHSVLADNLKNPNASPRQVLALLAALARFSHFPPQFKEACSKVCSEAGNSDLASLSGEDLINAFNIHLCAVFDGPAALKHWLTEDEDMKAFFQVHTSLKWYQNQDRERANFLQSPAYTSLREAAEAEGLDLRPSDPGEVYHVELVSVDAAERLKAWSKNPPTAVVCIKSKEQLQWYVPITADGLSEEDQMQNRCAQFRFMFRDSVQKLRHLQAMGYRPAVVWMSEWNALTTKEERQEYLRAAVGSPGHRNMAFSPSSETDAYV
eukprot:TRINITY_DN7428_c0_g1_i1.p1 TRINITY_DN7428_c0_g1~~TRINITY_DN7428_c0_g1_i1.p1  ORF type:complete len:558 (+),score=126.57 TRINITY_DN7428_c0_g1_i1:317-1990(+)